MRFLILLLSLPGALTAQDLVVPDDWTWRLDGQQQLATGREVAAGEWRYVRMPPGWHVTTTAEGVSLFPKGRSIDGRWGIEVEVFLFPNPGEAPFGVLLEAVDAPVGTMQLEFLMRRDGRAALRARRGTGDTLLVPWTGDTAVAGHPGRGVIQYVLRAVHEGGTVRFAINGTEMFAFPAMGEAKRSVPGLRIGPGLNLHVSRFDLITPLAPPPRR